MTHNGERTRVAILGVGLIGGSIGLALREAGGYSSVGWDADPGSLELAVRLGALESATTSAADAVSSADLIVLATPVLATIPLLESVLAALPAGAVVTDAGSTKARLTGEAERLVGGRFVGGHPMAGSALSGVTSARADLFRAAPWFVTPTENTNADALALVTRLVGSCGAIPRPCDPLLHDQIAAALSHLPHVLAYGLAQTAADLTPAEWKDVAAGSLRDGTRVAASSPELWAGIMMDNRDTVLAAIDAHAKWTGVLRTALESRDADSLRGLLDRAREARTGFPQEDKKRD